MKFSDLDGYSVNLWRILVCLLQVWFRVGTGGDFQECVLYWELWCRIKWLQGVGGCVPQCCYFLKIRWWLWKRNVFWGFQKLVLTRSNYQKVPRKLAYAPWSRFVLLSSLVLTHILLTKWYHFPYFHFVISCEICIVRPGCQVPHLLYQDGVDSDRLLLKKEYAWHIGGALPHHELEEWNLLYHSSLHGQSFNTFLGHTSWVFSTVTIISLQSLDYVEQDMINYLWAFNVIIILQKHWYVDVSVSH